KKVVAIYPGSFDPLTNGHLDLIERGSKIFDELIVAIVRNPEKNPLFSLAERKQMTEALTERWDNVRVDTFEGLMVDYATRINANAVLRGIRAISDYEYELQMALMNRKLAPDLETVFMMPTEAKQALKLTERINRIEPSATMAVVAEADKLRSQGVDVVDFGAGEPHFATPQHIKDAAIAAIQGNFTKYTAVGGTAELRDAIVGRHAADFGSDYRREETMASVG